MKILLTLISILIFTDITIFNVLLPHHYREEQIMVNEGNNLIEVQADGTPDYLTCTFSHLDSQVVQPHTKHCSITTGELALPAYIHVKVENNEDHPIHYVLHAATILPIK